MCCIDYRVCHCQNMHSVQELLERCVCVHCVCLLLEGCVHKCVYIHMCS